MITLGLDLKKVHSQYCKIRRNQKAVKKSKKMADAPTYYPEMKRKPYKQRKKDNYIWAKEHGEANEFYTLYGLDVIGLHNPNDYIDNYSFIQSRNRMNKLNDWWSYIALLRDKFLFYKIMKSNGFPVPNVFAVIKEGELFDVSMNHISWEAIKKKADYFIKDIDGECASYVRHINDYSELLEIRNSINKGMFILQEKIIQHERMNLLNPGAINTLRIITINKDGNPYVLTSLLRVGTSKSGCVDNWAAGGIAIGIETDGRLKKEGFYKPIHGTKTVCHPDTKVEFSSFTIPLYAQALEMACAAHKCFYGIGAIGWDVAISTFGPVFIEGNDNFEISLQQACDRPLRKEWIEASQ